MWINIKIWGACTLVYLKGFIYRRRRIINAVKGGTNQSTHLYNLLQTLMSLYMEVFHQGDPLIGRWIKGSLNMEKRWCIWLGKEPWEELAQCREPLMGSKEGWEIFWYGHFHLPLSYLHWKMMIQESVMTQAWGQRATPSSWGRKECFHVMKHQCLE